MMVEHGGDDAPYREPRLLLKRIGVASRTADRAYAAGELAAARTRELVQHGVLVAEVLIEAAGRDRCALGDRLGCGLGVAALGELTLGSLEQRGTRLMSARLNRCAQGAFGDHTE